MRAASARVVPELADLRPVLLLFSIGPLLAAASAVAAGARRRRLPVEELCNTIDGAGGQIAGDWMWRRTSRRRRPTSNDRTGSQASSSGAQEAGAVLDDGSSAGLTGESGRACAGDPEQGETSCFSPTQLLSFLRALIRVRTSFPLSSFHTLSQQ